MIIGIKIKFDAAHYLPNYPGKCREMHGHTWTVEVEICGLVDKDTGMVLDLTILKTFVADIIKKLDHKLLNEVLPSTITDKGMSPCIPTCENVACYIRNQLLKVLSFEINSIKVQEGDGGWARI